MHAHVEDNKRYTIIRYRKLKDPVRKTLLKKTFAHVQSMRLQLNDTLQWDILLIVQYNGISMLYLYLP